MENVERLSSQPKHFATRKIAIVTGLIILAAAAVGAYFVRPTADPAAQAPVVQTAKVRTGDLIITASGAGNILPAVEMELGFRAGGMLSEVNVTVGDAAQQGQILARLEGNIQAEADFQALFTPEGVAHAELAVVDAQDALEDAENDVIYLIGSDAWYWEGQLEQAAASLAALDASGSQTQKDEAQKAVDLARTRRDYSLDLRGYIDESDLALARANLESVKVALLDAQAALEIVEAGPEALTAPIPALGARMAELEQSRLVVESTRLVAPFDGTVTSLDAVVGQSVGTTPFLTLATTDQLLARFYLDETDLNKVAVGNPVRITLDAYPDFPLEGQVVKVEPALQVVDDTPVVVAWATLPSQTETRIMSGMTVDVEVIAGEARSALIVPIQALRELEPGVFAVLVVQPDGQMKLTPVTVGLRDYANAEIQDGLKAGDIVSTGTVETK